MNIKTLPLSQKILLMKAYYGNEITTVIKAFKEEYSYDTIETVNHLSSFSFRMLEAGRRNPKQMLLKEDKKQILYKLKEVFKFVGLKEDMEVFHIIQKAIQDKEL